MMEMGADFFFVKTEQPPVHQYVAERHTLSAGVLAASGEESRRRRAATL